MSNPQEFTVAPVRSEDPKKKKEDEEPKGTGSKPDPSKTGKDGKKKDGESDEQELVCSSTRGLCSAKTDMSIV